MLSFQNDYQEGAGGRKILARLIETNLEPLSGYGSDPSEKIRKKRFRLHATARKPMSGF
ncbi:MAG: hypothetical protein V8S38_08070 [Lachnospiraceae bacterium]